MAATNLYSVNPNPVFIHRGPLGDFTIQGKPPESLAAVLTIEDVPQEVVDSVRNRPDGSADTSKHIVVIDGADIAKEFIRLEGHNGLFVAKGNIPTNAEISTATSRMEQTFREAIREADAVWEKDHNRTTISETARRGARYFRMEAAWSDPGSLETKMKACPFCAEQIRAEATKCRYCQSDLNGAPAAKGKGN